MCAVAARAAVAADAAAIASELAVVRRSRGRSAARLLLGNDCLATGIIIQVVVFARGVSAQWLRLWLLVVQLQLLLVLVVVQLLLLRL